MKMQDVAAFNFDGTPFVPSDCGAAPGELCRGGGKYPMCDVCHNRFMLAALGLERATEGAQQA